MTGATSVASTGAEVEVETKHRVLVSWSSGKDSAWALHRVLQDTTIEVAGLLVTVQEDDDRVAMHGVASRLVSAQARALGLPVSEMRVPWPCPNAVYEERLGRVLESSRNEGVIGVVFGDLFLEEIREYRVRLLAGSGVEPLFPLWGEDTTALARQMVAGGLEAEVILVDLDRLPESFLGRRFDRALLDDLPPGVDPCGENGELHTFTLRSPEMSEAVAVEAGRRRRDGRFVWQELELRPEKPRPPTGGIGGVGATGPG